MSRSFAAHAAGRFELCADSSDSVGLLQPHGVVLVVREPGRRIVQASAHAGSWLGQPLETILLGSVDRLGGDLAAHLHSLPSRDDPAGTPSALALNCTIGTPGACRPVEAWVHRAAPDLLTIDLLPAAEPSAAPGTTAAEVDLLAQLEDAIHSLSQANTIDELAAQAVRHVKALCGHEEVRIVRFEPEAGARVVFSSSATATGGLAASTPRWSADLHAESDRFPDLRDGSGVDVLVDTLVDPVGLLPQRLPGSADVTQGASALARSTLRSPAPSRLARLRAAGVRAEVRAGLLREGRPWGLIACLDGRAPRPLTAPRRLALGLLVEAVATRITAIESAGRAEVAEQVRRLQDLLIDAATHEGDWRGALLRTPHLLLQPLQASGAALLHDGESLCWGMAPGEEQLGALAAWLGGRGASSVWRSDDLAAEDPRLAACVPPGTRLLAARLSFRQPDYLLWFRQAGGPEQTAAALPWSATDLARAASFAEMLVDLMVQVDAVRLLITGRQLQHLQAKVADSREAVVVCDAQGTVTLVNEAFAELTGRTPGSCRTLDHILALFTPAVVARRLSAQVRAEQRSARSVLALPRPDRSVLPVAVRAEPVLARSGGLMGMIFLVEDLTSARLAEAAWTQLQGLLGTPAGDAPAQDADPVVSAIRTHASLAAMDMADTTRTPGLAPLLQEVESATQRAIELYRQLSASLRRPGQ